MMFLSVEELIAQSNYHAALIKLKAFEKSYCNSAILGHMTRCHLYLGQFTEGERYANKHIKLLQKEKKQDTLEYVAAVNRKAAILCGMAKCAASKPFTLECIEIVKRMGYEETLEYAQVFVTASHVGIQYQNWEAALEGYERAKEILDEGDEAKLDYIESWGTTLTGMAFCYQKLNKRDQAFILFDFAVKEMERLGGKKHVNYALALHGLGLLCFENRLPDVAMHHFQTALRIYAVVFGMKHEIVRRLSEEMVKTIDALDLIRCLICKQPRHKCTTQCLADISLIQRRDTLRCRGCGEMFAMTNISRWGVLYCDKPDCVKLFG